MDIKDYIRRCCKDRNISMRQAALKAGISPQNLNYKLKNDRLTTENLEGLASSLDAGLEIILVDKKTAEPLPLNNKQNP